MPDARVLFHPASAYREPPPGGKPAVLLPRRPLLIVFFFGCLVSAAASGRYSVRLIADGAVSFAFVPAIGIAAFAAVYRASPRPRLRFAAALDLFFTTHAPWLVWLAALAALASVVPPRQVGPWVLPILATFAVPIAWSAWIDFHYFRQVLRRSPREAVRDLLLFRAIGWTAGTAYFLGIAIWSETLPQLARWAGL